MSKHNKTVSLQKQYVISALLMAGIVLFAAFITYIEFIKNTTSLTNKIRATSSLLELTAQASKNIYQLDKAIDAFMLEPDRNEQRNSVQDYLVGTQTIIARLQRISSDLQLALSPTLTELSGKINQLGKSAETVFNIRTNAMQQYPSLDVTARFMRPIRNKLHTVFDLALSDIQESKEQPLTTEVIDLIHAQTTWLRTVSEYRLYLTNRFGSFNQAIMREQEQGIDNHITELREKVNKILKPARKGFYGFEGSEEILKLPELVEQWGHAYSKVKAINNSNNWRRDSEYMRTVIVPLENDIGNIIEQIDSSLSTRHHQLMNDLRKSASSHNFLLAGVISIFLIYIIASLFLLKTMLIKPIALIAKTLKEEADNPSSLTRLQLNQTTETKDLIDAFVSMGQQVASRQKELEYHALHDPLTSLPNRMLLNQRLEYQTLIANREKTKFSLLFLDLNRFKEINDTLGHHIGDELLAQISQRLSDLIRNVDTVARLGGDEFAVLLPQTDRNQAVTVAQKISATLRKGFSISNYSLQVSTSIGITEFPSDGDNLQRIIQHADIAMYSCKKNKSNYEFYDPEEDTLSLAQVSLGRDLKQAIENHSLEMHFQPKVDLQTGEINGAEALLRWNHPEMGYINPEKIIEVAERAELLDHLTYWIIHQSIQTCSHSGLPDSFDLSINLAVQSLRDSNLITETRNAIEMNPGFTHRLTFEVTESAMMNNPEQSIKILNALKKLGIKISIDDFGTGFSSLAYLKQLPVSQLKIDRSFVMDMQDDESDRAIVLSTINLSHSLGLDVVAEGVENLPTARLLKGMNCNSAQGYYFSKPVAAGDFLQFLSSYQPDNFGFQGITD